MVIRNEAIRLRHLYKWAEKKEIDMECNSKVEIRFQGKSLDPCIAFLGEKGDVLYLAPFTLKDLKIFKKDLLNIKSLRAGNGTPLASTRGKSNV